MEEDRDSFYLKIDSALQRKREIEMKILLKPSENSYEVNLSLIIRILKTSFIFLKIMCQKREHYLGTPSFLELCFFTHNLRLTNFPKIQMPILNEDNKRIPNKVPI